MALYSGLVFSGYIKRGITAPLIPVDQSVAGMIACGWDVAQAGKREPQIFNNSNKKNPLSWSAFDDVQVATMRDAPLTKALWYIDYRCFT